MMREGERIAGELLQEWGGGRWWFLDGGWRGLAGVGGTFQAMLLMFS